MLYALVRKPGRTPELHLPEYAPEGPIPIPVPLSVDCPVCNRDGEGTGHIVRFIGKDGKYSVWESLCPICHGTRKANPCPDSNGIARMNEAAQATCLECGNTRRTVIPAHRSPTGEDTIAACPVCSVSEIVF